MSIRALPKELQKKAKLELNEVPDRVENDLQHIRDWLTKQLHLKAKTDDQTLITFLRNGKFSLQRTKEKIDAFYTMKSLTEEILKERNPFLPEIQEFLNRGIFSVFSDTSKPLSPIVIFVQWGKIDFEKQTMNDMMKLRLMILDILINEYDAVVVNGLHLVEDFKGFPLTAVSQISISVCKMFVMSFQDVYPIRLKECIALNAPIFFETIFSLLKPFLKDKMKKRIIVYGSDFSEITRYISPTLLPNEYGGKAGKIGPFQVELKKKIESYGNWFLDNAQYGTDETKRPGKPKTTLEEFGTDGSFRKLNID